MSYFVTGATGFIGRHLVERLLEREGDINVLVREESQEKLDALREGWGPGADRVKPIVGDLSEPLLGVSEEDRKALAGVEHFFHLAAIYDMAADEERNRRLNVNGTQNAIDLANELGAGHFHHASSIAVAGEYEGHFTEDSFDEGQKLTHPYHRTKYEAEKLVRQRLKVPWRVYRPSVVVGNSETGEMDKIDGPYYFFKAIQKARHALPEWFPLVGIEVGKTNIVPVDYVAAAMDHIAHLPDLDGQAFHLVDPKMTRAGDVINTFAQAGHAPKMVIRVDKKMTDMLPKGVLSYAMKLPALKDIRALAARRPRHPGLDHRVHRPQADLRRARHQARARRLGHRAAAARVLRREAVGLLGAQPRPRPVQGPLLRARGQRQDGDHHRRLERHRPGRGAQDRRGRRDPDPRRPLDGQARGGQGRDRARGRHRLRVLVRPLRLRLDRRHARDRSSPSTPRSTCWSTTRAARSGAPSRSPTTASTTTSARSSSTTSARSS